MGQPAKRGEADELPTFEVTNKPWFGPKKRAKELLEEHRTHVMRPGAEALQAMKEALGEAFDGLQHIRFIDFVMDGAFHYTIALCWTDSREKVRDAVYVLGPDCVAQSGWYPLPQGERLGSVAGSRALGSGDELPEITVGSLSTISAAANGADAGTAVRASFTDGATMLLDAGFGSAELRWASDKLVVVSHHHRDHIGGVEQRRLDGIPVGIPRASAVSMQAQGRLAPIQRRNAVSFIEPGVRYRLGQSVSLTAMAVPHMPGSVGFLLDDGVRALLYTGDIALRSARHQIMDVLLTAIPPGRRATILLDATMAGRQEGASQATPAQWVVKETDTRDVVVVAHHDHLLYAYLDIFHSAKSGPERNTLHLVVTSRVRPLFGVLHDAFIRRQLESLDPFLAGQYGKTMSAWGESRWLYWFTGHASIPKGPRVWFLTPEEVENAAFPSNAALLTIGRATLPVADTPSTVDTTPWTGHSDQESLADGVRAFEAAGHDVVLFHNFRKRLARFSRDNGVGAKPLLIDPHSL